MRECCAAVVEDNAVGRSEEAVFLVSLSLSLSLVSLSLSRLSLSLSLSLSEFPYVVRCSRRSVAADPVLSV